MTIEEYMKMYNCIMNKEEISNISDSKIRNIKMKYFEKRYKAFLSENDIKDSELENEYNRINEMEKNELMNYFDEYKNSHTNPKYALIEQEVEMMEDMTEGQLAEYIAENFDY